MLPAVTRVLRLAFDPPMPGRNSTPDEGREPTHIEFVGYTDDCALSGRIRLDADRLTDLLNGADTIELVDIEVQSLITGEIGTAEHLELPRSELFAVVAHPPRGNPARRRPTRQHAIAAGAGRYLLHGHLHTRPGSDPLLDVGRRPPMIPLTDATVRYSLGGEWRCDEAEVLLINRDRADWLRLAPEAEVVRIAAEFDANEAGPVRRSFDGSPRPALTT